jgi:hypothetical protein
VGKVVHVVDGEQHAFPAAASLTSSAAARKSGWWVLCPAHEAGVPFRARSISSRCGPRSERPAGQFTELDRVHGHAAAGIQDDLIAT